MKDLDAFGAFEAAHESLARAEEEGDDEEIEDAIEILMDALVRLYKAHGSPCGPREEDAGTWYAHNCWTTSN